MINRSESQLIAREQLNQVLKSSRPAAPRMPAENRNPVRTEMPRRKSRAS
ncbi:MAG: hypothetical protein AB7I04_15020 [Pseudomonadales bacterium]